MVTSETAQAMMTQLISNPTLVWPKFHPVFEVMAATKASPQFIATFATTVNETPAASVMMPRASMPRDSA